MERGKWAQTDTQREDAVRRRKAACQPRREASGAATLPAVSQPRAKARVSVLPLPWLRGCVEAALADSSLRVCTHMHANRAFLFFFFLNGQSKATLLTHFVMKATVKNTQSSQPFR